MAIVRIVEDARTLLWTLRRTGVEVCCEGRLLRGGIEGRIDTVLLLER